MSHLVSDVLVEKRNPHLPVMPQTAARAAAELAVVIRRLTADATRLEGWFARRGEPFEGLRPERYAALLDKLRTINPPGDTATIVSLVWMLTDAVHGLTVQMDAAKEPQEP